MPIKQVRPRQEITAGLDSRCENKELIIRPVDKWGGIVIFDRCDYMSEMHKILADRDTYTPLTFDPKTLSKIIRHYHTERFQSRDY